MRTGSRFATAAGVVTALAVAAAITLAFYGFVWSDDAMVAPHVVLLFALCAAIPAGVGVSALIRRQADDDESSA
jgi:hypothetical protein